MWFSALQIVNCGLCLTTGAVLEVTIAPFKTGEWEMARQLYTFRLQSENVIVMIHAYGTYVDVLVQAARRCAIFRKHHARHCDFRVRQKLGIRAYCDSSVRSVVRSR